MGRELKQMPLWWKWQRWRKRMSKIPYRVLGLKSSNLVMPTGVWLFGQKRDCQCICTEEAAERPAPAPHTYGNGVWMQVSRETQRLHSGNEDSGLPWNFAVKYRNQQIKISICVRLIFIFTKVVGTEWNNNRLKVVKKKKVHYRETAHYL